MRSKTIISFLTFICILSGCSRDPKARAQHFLESGKQYVEKKQYDAAAIQFRRAVQLNPGSAEAYYLLGINELRQRNLREAYSSLTKATELDPRHASALTELAALKQVARRTDESRALLQRVLAIEPTNINAHMLLGSASLQEGRYSEALQEFKEAQQIAPTDARILAQVGDCYVLLKRYSEGITSYQSAIEANQSYLPAYINLAQVYGALGNPELRIATLKTAIQRNPKEITPYVAVAEVYVRSGSGDKVAPLFNDLRSATDDSALSSLAIADFYRAIGDTQSAKTELQRLLGKDAKNDVARMKLIEVHINRQEWDDAERLNEELLKLHPKNPQVRLFHARLLFVRGNRAGAISALEQLTHDVPEMALAHFYLGVAHAEDGRFERAVASLNEAIKRNPDFVLAYVSLGELYSRENQPKLALEFADKALARNPQLISARLVQANSYMQIGDDATAESKLRELAVTQSKNPVVLERLGFVALRQKRIAEAQNRFEDALQAQPDYVPAMVNLLQIYTLQNRSDEGIARIRKQIERAPRQSVFYQMLGDVYLRQQDYKNAEQSFSDALQQDKKADGANVQLARVYAATGRLPQAIQAVKDVLQDHADYVPGYLLLGTFYEQTGAMSDAQKAYQDALQRNPDYAPVLNNLAWLYCENGGNLDLALSLAQRAKQSLPMDPSVSDTLAWIEYKKGLYSTAAQQLKDLVKQKPTNGLYHYHLGMALMKAGKPLEARESLMRAIESNLATNYVQDAKATIAHLDGKSI